MSQRESGYARKERDAYETPEWVTQALLPHLPTRLRIWEPAAGAGKMLRALRAAGHAVVGTDIVEGVDFLTTADPPPIDAIITNPPYGLAQEFIERALACAPLVAMSLRTDYDHAKTRQHLFGKCPAFAKKLVLTRRIVWFESEKAAPSFNHAWYIWDQSHTGSPVLAYH
jgi:hypothetical protein